MAHNRESPGRVKTHSDSSDSERQIIFTHSRPAGTHSSGAVPRWTSWAVRPNEPSGFRRRKDLLNRASALVTTCP